MEKLSLGVAATATATCDCNHETLVEHMEVKLTKVTGGAQWNKALAADHPDVQLLGDERTEQHPVSAHQWH